LLIFQLTEPLMAASLDDRGLPNRLEHIEELLQQVEQFPDPKEKARLREIVQSILELHRDGLERLLGHIAATGDAGQAVLGALAEDEDVATLLLLYGLHPHGVEGPGS
jgi:hypothetical protein